jgi:hypothetical protein
MPQHGISPARLKGEFGPGSAPAFTGCRLSESLLAFLLLLVIAFLHINMWASEYIAIITDVFL